MKLSELELDRTFVLPDSGLAIREEKQTRYIDNHGLNEQELDKIKKHGLTRGIGDIYKVIYSMAEKIDEGEII